MLTPTHRSSRSIFRKGGFTLVESILAAALGLSLFVFAMEGVRFFSKHTSSGTSEALELRELTILFDRLRRILTISNQVIVAKDGITFLHRQGGDTLATLLRMTPEGWLEFVQPNGRTTPYRIRISDKKLEVESIRDEIVKIKILDQTLTVVPLDERVVPLVRVVPVKSSNLPPDFLKLPQRSLSFGSGAPAPPVPGLESNDEFTPAQEEFVPSSRS